MVLLTAEAELRLIGDLLLAAGVSEEDAEMVADDLVEADLRGHDSHGLGRLNMQLDNLRSGRVRPDAEPSIVQNQSGSVVVDADRALGPPAVYFGLNEAVARASEHGSCTVAIRNHGYIAYLGRYVERPLEHDCIAILLGKSRGNVHPWGGVQPLVGSNPIAAAIPTEGDPLLVDMSTSASAMGRILEAIRNHEPIPEGWAVDQLGAPTTDPLAARRGALSPLGGPKGFALGLLVELLTAVLAGGGHEEGALWSSLAIVLHIPSFMEPEDLRRQASAYLHSVKASPQAPGFAEILLPGERAYRTRRERLQSGIPHPDDTWHAVLRYCEAVGLDPAAYLP
jgi:LDH2 family malate/lactate/ureidoglycolate dehydrogenase